MDNLSAVEQEIIAYWKDNPLATNEETARGLYKSPYTLQIQINAIYKAMGIPTKKGAGNLSRLFLYAKLGWIATQEVEE